MELNTLEIAGVTLLQWWVGASVLAAGTLAAAGTWWWRRRRGAGAVVVAGTERLRALPAFRALVRTQLRDRRFEVCSLAVALLGCALLAGRWVGVADDSEEMRNRDVVLCMDVSGSMRPVVRDVLDSYIDLVDTLHGERIGFVMFDGNAVTGFPLTTDYQQVRDRLVRTARQLDENAVIAGTVAPRSGSSLVGDGLASCVQHFDRAREQRSRTVVLATDNLVSGDSIYTLTQAADLAVARGVMVFAVVPQGNRREATAELRTQTERTHGRAMTLDPTASTNTVVVQRAITAQQKKVILAAPREHGFDRVWPGALLLALGLLGSLVTRRKQD